MMDQDPSEEQNSKEIQIDDCYNNTQFPPQLLATSKNSAPSNIATAEGIQQTNQEYPGLKFPDKPKFLPLL